VRATVNLGRPYRYGRVLRLGGPTFAATNRVTLGGGTIDERGAWAPKSGETTHVTGGNFTIIVPTVSAATVAMSLLP
jgi:hypothetical protein